MGNHQTSDAAPGLLVGGLALFNSLSSAPAISGKNKTILNAQVIYD